MTATLFGRLRQLRKTVKQVRDEVETLRNSMSRKSKPVPGTGGWEPAEDLYIQLGNVLRDLGDAQNYLAPLKQHIDQPVRESREVAHG